MTFLQNPKERYILKMALIYSVSMLIFLPVIKVIGENKYQQILWEKITNFPKLLLSFIIFFS